MHPTALVSTGKVSGGRRWRCAPARGAQHHLHSHTGTHQRKWQCLLTLAIAHVVMGRSVPFCEENSSPPIGSHMLGHISYFITPPARGGFPPAVFTGDVLFVGGCGRFFEGRPEQMCLSMLKLGALPAETLVSCTKLPWQDSSQAQNWPLRASKF
eukprot:scaffold31485_cov32-Tisochrysis_lutea.AAC.2